MTDDDDARRSRPDDAAPWHRAGRLEALHGRRQLVLRDRGGRVQGQPDRPRRGDRAGAAGTGGRAPSGARGDRGTIPRGLRGPGTGRAPDPPRDRAPATSTPGTSSSSVSATERRRRRHRPRSTRGRRPAAGAPGASPRDAPGPSTASAQAGIATSVHFIPLHLHPLYRRMGYRAGQFPAAEAAYAGAISLPIWPGLTDAQIDRVIEAVRTAI